MHLLDLSLVDPAANLALDEALLEEAEAAEKSPAPFSVVRLWEFSRSTAILGRGSRADGELDLEFCRRRGVEVLRRCSGGAAVVGGPGCLMYSLVLSMRAQPSLRQLDTTHRWVMSRLAESIGRRLPGVAMQGTCDLTWRGRKFSGNSLRLARDHLLYHGTLLYAASLDLLAGCLKTPPRQPDYRGGRGHRQFVTNVPLDAGALRAAVGEAFGVTGQRTGFPAARTDQLTFSRYATEAWTFRH
jgi:lipoate---protein ligase